MAYFQGGTVSFKESIAWKTNMEPENHPCNEKEKHLNQTFMTLGSMLVFAAICICDLMPQTWVGFQHQNTGNFPFDFGFHVKFRACITCFIQS